MALDLRSVDKYIPRDKWAGSRSRHQRASPKGALMKKIVSAVAVQVTDVPGNREGRAALVAERSKTAGGRSSEKMHNVQRRGQGARDDWAVGRLMCVTLRQRPNNNNQSLRSRAGYPEPRAARDEGAGW